MKIVKSVLSLLALMCGALLAQAAVQGQSPLASARQLITRLTALPDAPLALQGPGLGNLSYTEAELFTPVSWIRRDDQGVPDAYPGRNPYGLNVGIMHKGYFLTVFAPDSGAGPGGFLLYDVSNPRAIQLVKRIYEPEGRTSEFREAHALGSTTLGGRSYIVLGTTKGLEFWDFTDINDIRQVKKLVLPTVNGGDYANVSWQLWWQAPYVYVASANDGIYIIDAHDPANAQLADRGPGRPNPVPTGELGGFRVGPIFTLGNQMVLSSMDNSDGFASLDISDPLNPKVLDTVQSLPTYYATCFDGQRLYASVRGAGARMFGYSLADRSRFVAEDDRLAIDEQLYCGTQDHFVFQGAQYRVHKVDVSNPLQHVEVGRGGMFPPGSPEESHSDHGQVAPFGNLLFIGNDHGSGSAFMVHDRAPDTTPPTVRQVSPANGAGQQGLSSRIGLGLSDSILPESVHAGSFIVRPVGGNTLAGTYSVQLGIINFSPAEPLQPGTTYEVLLPAGGVKDYAGNGIASDYHASFTTGSALDIGLVHHWSLARTLADPVGRSNGVSSDGDSFEPIGLNLAGRSAGVSLADDSVASVLGGTSSVSFYLKTSQVGTAVPWTAPGLFGRDQFGGSDDVFWGWLDDSGRIALTVGGASASHPVLRSSDPVNNGAWHHIVMTRDAASGAQTLYVDGVRQSSTGRTGVLGLGNRFSMLGQIQGNADLLRGTLADVRVYARVLGDADVADLRSLPIVGDPGLGGTPRLVNGTLQLNPQVLMGSSAQFRWNFGDGQQSGFAGTPAANHVYTRPGHYSVTLTVRNAAGLERFYSFVLTVIHPPTTVQPTHTSNIVGDAGSVYALNPDSGTVSAVDAQTLVKRWEVSVGREPRTLARGPDGRLWVAVQGEDRLLVLNSADGSVAARIDLDYGSGPYGVVFTPDGSRGLLSLEHQSRLLSFDPASGAITGNLDLAGDLRGIAVAADSQTAYVTRFRSTASGGLLHKVALQPLTAATGIALRVDSTTVDDESRARGVPNYLHQVVIAPDGRRAVLPSKKDNILRGRHRDGQDLLHDRTVRSILSQVDLAQAAELIDAQLDFDDRAPARAALYAPQGDYLFVAQMEGNRVAIVDPYTRAVRGEIGDVGRGPHGLYLDASRKRLFINNFLGRSVSVYDVAAVLASESAAATRVQTVSTVAQEPLSAAALRGKQLFYNAADRRMSRDNYMSCASCHADGGDDGMVWDLTQRGEGLRRTISLQGRQGLGHGRLHWSANFDEVQDFENDVRNAFGGTGFMSNADFAATANPLGTPKAGRSADLDDLAAYLSSLSRYGRSPARLADGSLSASAQQGRSLFASAQCSSCHSGLTLRDGLRHDVGTIRPSSGLGNGQPLAGVGFDTPTLFDLWRLGSYFHDGQATDLASLLAGGHGGADNLAAPQRQALVDYLRSLDATSALLRLRSSQSQLCVNIADASTAEGAKALQRNCGSTGSEQFAVNNVDGRLQFVVRHSGLCLAQADTSGNGGAVVQQACNSGDRTQWRLSGSVLRNHASGACLDVPGNSSSAGAELITWACHGGSNQNWTLQSAGQ
ncbi:Ig-like domain-containing protein [Roseateles amylovorans]|uniref:Ricin-type beta-trefoil lectin domain protein n=1 Tax=Roseateles amylovorans TaxID=2978473 RepID=A0ABY6B9V9_9BURK|nr:Ig-like domain-containing protein [Roseateles amylovorans]UXH80017.1 ricin-type beta-trefoil lectin domain protein [Roseateles amylovorans]